MEHPSGPDRISSIAGSAAIASRSCELRLLRRSAANQALGAYRYPRRFDHDQRNCKRAKSMPRSCSTHRASRSFARFRTIASSSRPYRTFMESRSIYRIRRCRITRSGKRLRSRSTVIQLTRKITHGAYSGDTAMRGLFTWSFDPTCPRRRSIPPKRGVARSGRMDRGIGGIRSKNGHRLQMELSFATGYGITTRFATAIAAAERAIGIDVSLRQYDRTQFFRSKDRCSRRATRSRSTTIKPTTIPTLRGCSRAAKRAARFQDCSLLRCCTSTRMLRAAASSFDRARAHPTTARYSVNLPRISRITFLCQISEVDVIPGSSRVCASLALAV